mmetsp:Transcript_82031/g.129687  ORF Transcript_82031/g.129687 Transcript_82031/m.129687 type:complete len:109 (-) Transcript_82031:137-463(-)
MTGISRQMATSVITARSVAQKNLVKPTKHGSAGPSGCLLSIMPRRTAWRSNQLGPFGEQRQVLDHEEFGKELLSVTSRTSSNSKDLPSVDNELAVNLSVLDWFPSFLT